MNPKIFVGAAVAALAVILGGILLVGPTDTVSSQNGSPANQNIEQSKPIEIKLDDIIISKNFRAFCYN